VGGGTLTLILVLKRVGPRVPGALVAVVSGVVVVAVFALEKHGVAVVGPISSRLPVPGLPDVSMSDLVQLLPAAGIALVGYTDNVLTARSLASRRGYRIDANQELLALGLSNLTSGLSQGFPVSSSASRAAVPPCQHLLAARRNWCPFWRPRSSLLRSLRCTRCWRRSLRRRSPR
jgi:MFS superfamily sulfate permease-like transporter